jgi:hypothetical protein
MCPARGVQAADRLELLGIESADRRQIIDDVAVVHPQIASVQAVIGDHERSGH